MGEIREFIRFGNGYLKARLMAFGRSFEKFKDIIVAFLIVKRGKYSTSFLNTSFLLLIVTAFVAGPIIAENNPFVSHFQSTSANNQAAAIVSFDPSESSLATVFSDKPRASIVEYNVQGGETLSSIGKKFGVNTDTIKWANNLKTENIKPGQTLKIPPINGIVHKVSSGESIYSIAKKYQTNPQKIANFPFNDFVDLDTFSLSPGQTLYVPDGVPVQVKPVVPRYVATQYAPPAGVGSSSYIWPTTSRSVSQYPVSYHMALDIESRGNPPIFAAAAGTVIVPGFQPGGYGNHIIIDHGNGTQTLYAHLSSISVSSGQSVGQGAVIGAMGSTGRSTGTHLHFEVRQGGGQVNPLGYVH